MSKGRTRLMRVAVLAGVVLALFAASATPVFGGDTGTVNATVTAAAPCLLIEGASAIDFGTAVFSTAGPTFGSEVAKPVGTSTLVNCSGTAENLFARGTDAAGNLGAAWTLQANLTNPCTAGTDIFSATTTDGSVTPFLSTTNTAFGSLAAAGSKGIGFSMFMPCTGSSGAGETMSFSYIYTATF